MVEKVGAAATQNPLDPAAILKDTAITAVIAFAIFGPIVGLKTVAIGNGLALEQRWGTVAALVAIVAAGRLLINLFGVGAASSYLKLHALRVGIIAAVAGALMIFLSLAAGQLPVVGLPLLPPVVIAWLTIIGPIFLFGGVWLIYVSFAQKNGGAAASKALRDTSAYGRYFGIALLIAAIILPFIPGIDRRVMDLGILMLTYVMLGWGLNIVVGLAGLLDLGYVAFYAVGAYSYALLSTIYFPIWFGEGIIPWAFWLVLPIAGFLAALWGIILGFPVLRLRGDYLAIVTLAFGEIIRVILINWYDFTGGPNGISDIPRPSFFGIPFTNDENGFAATFGLEYAPIQRIIFLYYVILALALLTYFVTMRLRALPVGRAWEALREDEIACRSLGINTTSTKLTAFAIGAMFGGFAGSFFATRQGFVSPESFVFMESAIILAIVVLGGLGSQLGVVVAAIVIIGAFELFRELDFLVAVMPAGFDPVQYRMLAVGLAMVLIMRWRPRGLVTRREPTVYLKEKKAVSADLVAQGHG
ncbi:MAG: high-affinity branched-chain amino acid ABC transporter permease LivM [Rhizobiales bacterium]|nr:high-affinity branched-chain amino acid ABC transporter permease LivM [Hyphomicrobiales bacterium]